MRYNQSTIKKRLEAFFLDNIGIKVTRQQLIEIAKDPVTGLEPENWHQRLSELRTDDGYTILSHRDDKKLNNQEYLMPHPNKRQVAAKRLKPTKKLGKPYLTLLIINVSGLKMGSHVIYMKEISIQLVGALCILHQII